MSSSFRFEFKVNEYRKRNAPQLRPLSFTNGAGSRIFEFENSRLCKLFLHYLKSKDEKKEFIEVDKTVPDYLSIIKTPMDLEAIQKKLYSGGYSNANQFKDDVELIWRNCIQYNGTKHETSLRAMRLRCDFNEKWELYTNFQTDELMDILQLKRDVDSITPKLDSGSQDMELFRYPSRSYTRLPAVTAHKKSHKKENKVARMAVVNENEPLTDDEKLKLATDIDSLMPQLLYVIINFMKDSLHLDLSQDYKIPLLSIDTKILRKLQSIVKNIKSKEAKVRNMFLREMSIPDQIKILEEEAKKFEEVVPHKKAIHESDESGDDDMDKMESTDEGTSTTSSTSDDD